MAPPVHRKHRRASDVEAGTSRWKEKTVGYRPQRPYLDPCLGPQCQGQDYPIRHAVSITGDLEITVEVYCALTFIIFLLNFYKVYIKTSNSEAHPETVV